MKIVCGSCGAKYSIADEKVQGKVFKIRCKKCSNVIVVKGDAQQSDDQPQGSFGDSSMSGAYGGTSAAAEWYVVVDGDQVGPISPEEIEAYYASGRVTEESFAWREGLGDWVALSELDEFAHLAAMGGAVGEDATALMESPLLAQGAGGDGFGAESAPGFVEDDDATSLMPASDFRAQIAAKEAEAEAAAAGSDYGAGYDASYGSSAGFDSDGSQSGLQGQQDAGGYDSFGSDAAGGYGSSGAYDTGGSGGYGASGSGAYDTGQSGGYGASGSGAYDTGQSGGYGASGSGGFDSAGSDGYDAGGGYDGYGDEPDSGGGMFAAFDSGADGGDSGYDSFDSVGDSEGSSAANDLIGQRNENSVLFSLSSLDQVSAVSEEDAAPSAAAGGGAVTEGSGLIDIQALASAQKSMRAAGAGGGANAGDGADDPFGAGTMSMPALMPMGSHKSNKGLIIGFAVLGLLLLGAIGFGIVLMTSKEDPKPAEPVVKYVERPAPAADPNADKEQAEAAEAAAAAAKAAEEPAKEDDEAVAAAESDEEEADEKSVAKKEEKKSSSKPASSTRTASKPKPAPKPSKPAKKDDDIFALLDNKKDTKKPAPKAAKAAPKADVPPKLTRSMVKNTINKYNGRIHTCYTNNNKNKMSGSVMVRFNIKESGRVSSASISTSKFKGTDVGTCVERVVRSMKFPETQSSLPVNYPFVLK